MHGSPLLRTIVILLLLLAGGVPLWRMTHEAQAVNVLAPGASVAAISTAQAQVHLAVAFAQKPVKFIVSYLGKPIWQSDAVAGTTMATTVPMIYPKEGVDLEYAVTWPPGTALTAARLSVARGDAEPVEKTLWGPGQVDDILTFP